MDTGRKGIYFITGAPYDLSASYFEFATPTVHRVAMLPGVMQVMPNISVSPDGSMLLYAGAQSSESDLVLVEGFR